MLDILSDRDIVDNARSTRLGSSARVAQAVLRHEGGWTALYRGLTPNLIGNSTSWALYFLWYGELKKSISSLHGRRETLTPYDYFFASGIAGESTYAVHGKPLTFTLGILTAICTNPVWVIKTRMLATASIRTGAYASMSDGIRHIWKSDGVLGFYRGLVPSLFGVSHGALQFTAYEELKTLARKRSTSKGKKLTSWEVFWCGALSKAFAGSVTYPYQVVRSRLQLYDADRRYRNLRDVIFQVWRFEGFAGFYKGLGPNLLRVVPSSCITLLMYENTRAYLPKLLR